MKPLTLAALTAMTVANAIQPVLAQDVDQSLIGSDPPALITFSLHPNPKFLACLAPAGATPTATVVVLRGEHNDTLQINLQHIRPNLAFDLFTIQRSNLLADGKVDPSFKNFGLAWYQSDIQADSSGNAEVQIKTILLDQIFGFDADPLPGSVTGAPLVSPTQTFHVGFWFDNPHDAAACGFDPTKPTPFNGTHNAGPNAMISLPNATTGLGPLCTQVMGTSCKI